jgi:hypothetical protein
MSNFARIGTEKGAIAFVQYQLVLTKFSKGELHNHSQPTQAIDLIHERIDFLVNL